MHGFQDILDTLKARGFRTTKLRTALLDVLQESNSPLSVPEMQEILATRGLTPNKTSLYREVETLLQNEVAEESTISGVRKIYVSDSGQHHHHFVCIKCEETQCVEETALEKALHAVEKGLAEDHGMLVTGHDLTFYGRCKSCLTLS
ncbi:Fur family transcriptional regulator [soil metagenome]